MAKHRLQKTRDFVGVLDARAGAPPLNLHPRPRVERGPRRRATVLGVSPPASTIVVRRAALEPRARCARSSGDAGAARPRAAPGLDQHGVGVEQPVGQTRRDRRRRRSARPARPAAPRPRSRAACLAAIGAVELGAAAGRRDALIARISSTVWSPKTPKTGTPAAAAYDLGGPRRRDHAGPPAKTTPR